MNDRCTCLSKRGSLWTSKQGRLCEFCETNLARAAAPNIALAAELACPGFAYAIAIALPQEIHWFSRYMFWKTPEGIAKTERQKRISKRKERVREETRWLRQQVFKAGDLVTLGCAIKGFLNKQRKVDYHCSRQKDALWSRHALAACVVLWGQELSAFVNYAEQLTLIQSVIDANNKRASDILEWAKQSCAFGR